MTKTTYALAALISTFAIASLVVAVVTTPLAHADGLGEKCTGPGMTHQAGNPRDANEPHGTPQDNGPGNPHDINCPP
jgi:hypothetical protein